MNRLSIDDAEKKIAESLPQAKGPGIGAQPPSSKRSSSKVDNGDRTVKKWSKEPQYSGSPKPLKVDPPKSSQQGSLIGKPISSDKPKSAGKAEVGSGAAKTVKQPNMAVTKKGSKGIVADAGQMFPDMGKASLTIKKASAKGSEDKLMGANIKVATVKYAEPKFVKPELGWGLLGSQTPQKTVAETINGVVHVVVGGRSRRMLQAASPKHVAAICNEYVSVGVSPTVHVLVGHRPVYEDKKFRRAMFSYVHAQHHEVAESAGKSAQAAFERFVELTKKEAVGYRGGYQAWVKECAVPAFKQARKLFKAAYAGRVKTFEVTARLENETRRIVVGAIDTRHAAAAAFDRLFTETGFAKVKHVVVDNVKFMAEASGKGLFTGMPKQIELKLDVTEPPHSKKGGGEKAEVKAAKPAKASVGTASAKGVTRASGKSADKAKEVGGDAWSKAKSLAAKAPPATKIKDVVPPKATSPEFPKNSRLDETDRIAQEAIRLLSDLKSKTSGPRAMILGTLIEKIKGDKELLATEEKLLDSVLTKIMTKKK